MSYDPLKDFASVGIVDQFPFSLVVNPNLPVASLSEFVAYAKKNDGKLNFASWGNGSIAQIAFEQLKQSTGINLVHVPFQGAGPAITAVAGGSVEAFIVPLSVSRPQAASGRVKLLAVTSAKRADAAPEVPTASEQGVPLVVTGWHILAVPARTAQSTVVSLNRSLNTVTARTDIRQKLAAAGVQPAASTPEEAQAMVRAEWSRWGAVAKTAGITAD
jgi:tripartite-type tricarboxylate transporter receptor subunit TctC